jgi:hypothetical protein
MGWQAVLNKQAANAKAAAERLDEQSVKRQAPSRIGVPNATGIM